jgi:hypothetical protein
MHEFLINSPVFCPTWIDETNLWIIFSQEKYQNENSKSLSWTLEITKKRGFKNAISKLLQNSKMGPTLQLEGTINHRCSWPLTITFSLWLHKIVSTHNLFEFIIYQIVETIC